MKQNYLYALAIAGFLLSPLWAMADNQPNSTKIIVSATILNTADITNGVISGPVPVQIEQTKDGILISY